MTKRAAPAVPGTPWWDAEGWHVGMLAVRSWGACTGVPVQLPARWEAGPDGRGEVEPTDLEVACFEHLVRHEIARVQAVELVMLGGECRPPWTPPPPAEAEMAAARGESLVAWCPGLGWHWPTENREGPFARRVAR